MSICSKIYLQVGETIGEEGGGGGRPGGREGRPPDSQARWGRQAGCGSNGSVGNTYLLFERMVLGFNIVTMFGVVGLGRFSVLAIGTFGVVGVETFDGVGMF